MAEPSFSDGDLVRTYLREVGRWPLLTPAQESELGRRIDTARAELVGALAGMPCAIHTLADLANRVRSGQAPAAELVLLADGGELEGVARRSGAARDRAAPIGSGRGRACPHPSRVTRPSMRARCSARRRRGRLIARALARQPIRPSVVEEIVARLGSVDMPSRCEPRCTRRVRETHRPDADAVRRTARRNQTRRCGTARRQAAADRSRTSGSSSRLRSAIPTAACRCST